MITPSALTKAFRDHYGSAPTVIGTAPGRVNLIGEHTDYNEGFVLPVAIDRIAAVAARPRNDRQLHLYAANFAAETMLDLNALHHDTHDWSTYAAGMASLLEEIGYRLSGADLLIMGDVPTGSGLSSSAALEMALGTTLLALSGDAIGGVQLAQLGQRTENEWLGVKSGIMDQMISALGHANHALLIDCRDHSTQAIPMPADVRIVVCDSKKSRALAHSAYNERRAECEEAVRLLQTALPDIRALRDVSVSDFLEYAHLLPPTILHRARHVITENARVQESAVVLRSGNLERFGQFMNESHASLRDDYEVSSHELDTLVSAAQAVRGTYGSRLTGAGFGGCTVSLVAPRAVKAFQKAVTAAYEEAVGYSPEIYVCTASDGARAEFV